MEVSFVGALHGVDNGCLARCEDAESQDNVEAAGAYSGKVEKSTFHRWSRVAADPDLPGSMATTAQESGHKFYLDEAGRTPWKKFFSALK